VHINHSYLNAKELSSLLQVHPKAIYKQVEKREIPFIRGNGIGFMFRRKNIEDWLAKEQK
jgi:excisionase family DNA binding protein